MASREPSREGSNPGTNGKHRGIDGASLRRMRRALGLTQEQLAKRVGYSVRLIRKAESGQSISPATVQDLQSFFDASLDAAERTPLLLDHLQMTINIMTAYHTIGSGLVDKHLDYFHDDFVFISAGDPADFPFAGTHHGVDAFRDRLQWLESVYKRDPASWQIEYFTSQDPNCVLASYTETYEADGERLENLKTHLRFTFAEGLLVELTDDYDTGRNLGFWQRVQRQS